MLITTTNCCGVLLGTGSKVLTDGICSQVNLDLGTLQVVIDLLPLDLGGFDVIRGIQWLETLGNMEVNWHAMTRHLGTWR